MGLGLAAGSFTSQGHYITQCLESRFNVQPAGALGLHPLQNSTVWHPGAGLNDKIRIDERFLER